MAAPHFPKCGAAGSLQRYGMGAYTCILPDAPGRRKPPWGMKLQIRVEFLKNRDQSLGFRREKVLLTADGP